MKKLDFALVTDGVKDRDNIDTEKDRNVGRDTNSASDLVNLVYN